MRKTVLMQIAGIVLFCFGCSNTASEFPDEGSNDCVPAFPEMDVTYANYVKKIADQYCISCHNGSATAPGDFRTYNGLLPYAGGSFYVRVIQDNADMPQGMAPLPQAIRDSLNVWIENCAPAN